MEAPAKSARMKGRKSGRVKRSPELVAAYGAWEIDPDLPLLPGWDWTQRAIASEPLRREFPTIDTRIKTGPDFDVVPFLPVEALQTQWIDCFKDTRVNKLGFPYGHRFALNRLVLHNICLVYDRRGFCLFDGDGLSMLSSALPLFETARAQPVARISHGFFCGDMFNGDNISHQMLDHLGRALLYVGSDSGDGVPVFTKARYDYTMRARQRGLNGRPMLEIHRGQVYAFDRLEMFTTSWLPNHHPARYCDRRILDPLIVTLSETNGISTPEAGARGRRIFVSRADARVRQMINENALATALEGHGFETVEMSTLSPDAQLSLFRQAESIVAPHGAALTSLIACQPGTKVTEIFNPSQGTVAYAALAAELGLDYRPIFGKAAEGSNFRLPKADLQRVLDCALSAG